MKAAGLESELAAAGPLTLFVPTDAAFAKLPAGERDALLKPENKERLHALLLGHVVRDMVQVHDGDNGAITSGSLSTAAGTTIVFAAPGGQMTIGGARPSRPTCGPATGWSRRSTACCCSSGTRRGAAW